MCTDEALDQYAKQESLPSPSENIIKVQREWLDRSDLGRSFLKDAFEDVWDPERDTSDFMTFSPKQNLTSSVSRMLLKMWRFLSCIKTTNRVYHIDSSNKGGVALGISVVISSVFPVLPIVVLFFVDSDIIRVGLILVFTAVFAAVLVFGLRLAPEKVLVITTA